MVFTVIDTTNNDNSFQATFQEIWRSSCESMFNMTLLKEGINHDTLLHVLLEPNVGLELMYHIASISELNETMPVESDCYLTIASIPHLPDYYRMISSPVDIAQSIHGRRQLYVPIDMGLNTAMAKVTNISMSARFPSVVTITAQVKNDGSSIGIYYEISGAKYIKALGHNIIDPLAPNTLALHELNARVYSGI